MAMTTQTNHLDFVFLNSIDLLEATDTLLPLNQKTQELLEKALGRNFENGLSAIKEIVMRKQLIPPLKEYLESQTL